MKEGKWDKEAKRGSLICLCSYSLHWNNLLLFPLILEMKTCNPCNYTVLLHLSNSDLYNSVPIPYDMTIIVAKVKPSFAVQLDSYGPV